MFTDLFGSDMVTFPVLEESMEFGILKSSTEIRHEYELNKALAQDSPFDHALFVSEQLVADGEAGEWEVVTADDLHLLLDFDVPFMGELPVAYERVMGRLFTNFKDVKFYKSRSGNTHVIVELSEPLPMSERITWQAILGSDPMREALHMRSLKRGDPNAILLVMRKDRNASSDEKQSLA